MVLSDFQYLPDIQELNLINLNYLTSHFKITMRKISLAILFFLVTFVAATAQQVMYSQTFEDTANLFQDYVLSNLDMGTPTDSDLDTLKSVPWFVSNAGTEGNYAAVATSDYTPSVAADDWFITPVIRLGEKSYLSFKSLSMVAGTTDIYEIYISTTEQSVSGCLFNPVVWQYTSSNSDAFQSHILDLAAAGYSNRFVYIGFRLTTVSGGDKLAIDDIVVNETVTQFKDLKFIVNMSNYIADSLFNPRTDTVDVAGTFNNYDGTKNILSIVPGTDSAIYAVTIPYFLDGDRLEFKFRINSTWNDSIVEFPYGQPNRVWVIEKDKYTYTCFYNNQGTPFGIPENGIMSEINVYPNPAQTNALVKIPTSVQKIILVSLTGSKILELETPPGNSVNLDVNSLAKGTYILSFFTKQGFAGSKKLVKK
jgi:hypothetical protein